MKLIRKDIINKKFNMLQSGKQSKLHKAEPITFRRERAETIGNYSSNYKVAANFSMLH